MKVEELVPDGLWEEIRRRCRDVRGTQAESPWIHAER